MSTETVTFVNPTHGSILLHGGTNVYILKNRMGLDNVPFIINRERTPGAPGSRVTNVFVGERQITLPILVKADTPSAFITLKKNLNNLLNPLIQGSYLRWKNLADETKDLYVTYLGGLEGDDTKADTTWSTYDLRFIAPDPFWYSTALTGGVATGGTPTAFLGTPFLPLNINESSITGGLNITNLGDHDSWPIITLEGPASGIEIINNTTGKTLDLTAGSGLSLTAGQIATIRTKPGERSVLRDDLTNLFQYLTADSEFFSIIPGLNNIGFTASGTSAATEFAVSIYHTYSMK